jgi:hypothetical protein
MSASRPPIKQSSNPASPVGRGERDETYPAMTGAASVRQPAGRALGGAALVRQPGESRSGVDTSAGWYEH